MGKIEFNSYSREIDGQGYCSTIESYASNMMEENEIEASIIYPAKNKWGTIRSETYHITDESSYILLPYPIYKLISVKIKPVGLPISNKGSYDLYLNEAGESFTPDIAKFIVLDSEWNALPVLSDDDRISGSRPAQSNTFIYKQGDTSILLSGSIIKSPYPRDVPLYQSVINSALLSEEAKNYFKSPGDEFSLYDDILAYGISFSDVKKWEYRIEYIPLQKEVKVRAHKVDAKNREYTQVVNQRAEIIYSDTYGKYLFTTAQKTGTPEIKIAKNYKSLADVPKLGAELIKDGEKYRLVANSWQVRNPFTFTVIHTFSKAWASKSKHVSVDQKYRNWNIPFDDYVWRTIYYEEFVEIGGNADEYQGSAFNEQYRLESFDYLFRNEEKDIALKNMSIFINGNLNNGCIVPVSAQALGNSVVFTTSMKDSVSAGLRVNVDNDQYCRDVLYSKEDGTLEWANIKLTTGIDNYNANALPFSGYDKAIPGDVNTPLYYDEITPYFEEDFYIDKDPAEALKFVVQVHFIPIEKWIVVGGALAENFPMIVNKKKTIKLYGLKHFIRDGVDVIDKETLKDRIEMTYLPIFKDGFVEIPEEVLKTMIRTECVGWAVINENNRLLIGSNDITKSKIYFSWKKKRSIK